MLTVLNLHSSSTHKLEDVKVLQLVFFIIVQRYSFMKTDELIRINLKILKKYLQIKILHANPRHTNRGKCEMEIRTEHRNYNKHNREQIRFFKHADTSYQYRLANEQGEPEPEVELNFDTNT